MGREAFTYSVWIYGKGYGRKILSATGLTKVVEAVVKRNFILPGHACCRLI
jgi:hypothetical protein